MERMNVCVCVRARAKTLSCPLMSVVLFTPVFFCLWRFKNLAAPTYAGTKC